MRIAPLVSRRMANLPSLRWRVTSGTTLLLLLVFGMTLVGVSAMNSLSDAVGGELVMLRERNVLAQKRLREPVDGHPAHVRLDEVAADRREKKKKADGGE